MKKLPVAISEEEFTKLIKKTLKLRHKVAFLLGFGAGLRVSEIVGLKKAKSKCCKVDLERRRVKIDEKTKVIKYYCSNCQRELDRKKDIYRTKKDEWDIPKLTPEKINLTERTISIKNAKGQTDRVVPLPKGFKEKMLKCIPMKCGARALQICFIKTARRAGLLEAKPELHFHSLRHGFATQLVKQNVPIHHIRTLLGHSNISTTNIYLESNPREALKSYEELF